MMTMTRRLAMTAGLSSALLAAIPARAEQSWYPLVGPDGRPIANFRMPVEIETEISDLENVLTFGAEDADVTLVEVYDSNCGFCRRAAADLKAMAEADNELRVKLINAPSLGLASFQSARVEFAVKKVAGEERALAFHHSFMSERGFLDGQRALLIAADIGLDADEIERVADTDEVGDVIRHASRLANSANLAVTPAWLIGGTGILGWPGRASLEAIVAAVRQCDKPVCG